MDAQEIPNGFTSLPPRRPSASPDPLKSGSRNTGVSGYFPQRYQTQSSYGQSPSNGFSFPSQRVARQGAFQYSRNAGREGEEKLEFDPEKLKEIPERDRRWAWCEIDLNAISHNVKTVRRHIGPGVRLMAVVKADAYGHGAVPCARTALNSGADCLGVATVDEGIELREALLNSPVLVLSQPPLSAIPLLLAYKLTPAIESAEFAIQYAEAADAYGMRAPYHLVINSGMNRIGVRHDEVVEFLNQVSFHRALDLEGVFTHFATADFEETLDFQIQARRFIEAVNAIRNAGYQPGILHAANSAAITRFRDVYFDMVRLGISLYGYPAAEFLRPVLDLQPAMSVHARISSLRTVPMSEGVSYGMHYRSPGSVKICTLPIGYADGLRRSLSGRIDVLFEGQRCHQVGNICMDQCMFEVDLRTYGTRRRFDPQVGDEVVLVGRQGDQAITVEEYCSLLDTIPHEVTILFGNTRLPRIY